MPVQNVAPIAGLSLLRNHARVKAAGGSTLWTPFALGSALVAFWDAAVTTSLKNAAGNTVSNGDPVASWRDLASSILASQGTVANQPGYSATARNGKPGLTFNGSQYLGFSSNNIPTGTASATLWVAGVATAATGTYRTALGYGSGNTNARRLVGAAPSTNNCFLADGTVISVPVSFSTDRLVQYSLDVATHTIFVDGVQAGTESSVFNTVGTSGYIGADPTLSINWGGTTQLSVILNTIPSTSNRQKLEGWDSWHNGKNGANLPAGHPYKSAPPTMLAEDIERLFDEWMDARDAAYRRELGLVAVERPRLYLPPRRKLILPERMAA